MSGLISQKCGVPLGLASAFGLFALLVGPPTGNAQMTQPGDRVVVTPADLPPPRATPSATRPPQIVARPRDTRPSVPQGFTATLFAENLGEARNLAVAPNGDVFLAETEEGIVTRFLDPGGTAAAAERTTFATGLRMPHGLAFRDGALYVGDVEAVWRFAYANGDKTARSKPEPVTAQGEMGPRYGHWTRTIAFAPDGTLYAAIGSLSNLAEEPEPYASIRVFEPGAAKGRSFARGLRNPVGIALRPGTRELYAVVNERDGLGDDLVPDYFTRVVEGGFYGWPYSYIGANPQPGLEAKGGDLRAKALVPDVLFRSHSAPLGLVFYEGTQFPAEYRGDAFVSHHGSWNRSVPTGYAVVRVRFKAGKPEPGYETFASGFRLGGTTNAIVWGRPVGLAIAKDGALLIADDAGRTVWKVSYTGP
ncbi:MAG: PQQ-dependent sugar dehydrogenase [Proteobacteria bacterium]|nr:PQQ-dependent sugar dehydrogenase [Pseudomonadota bacterium]MBI3497091.1 PQQ-dependent sugar dehydrogenase [Pseudomonadota bacterium]